MPGTRPGMTIGDAAVIGLWLSRRGSTRSLQHLRGAMNRRADAHVGGAAADIGQLAVNVRIARIDMAAQQVGDRHDHAGLAIAALRNVELDPSLLHGMVAAKRKSFDRGDLFVLRHDDRHDAGARGGAVDMHGAGAAQSDAAAELASGEAEMLAHHPQQRHVFGAVEFGRLPVDGKLHRHALTAQVRGLAWNTAAGNGITSMRWPIALSSACAIAGEIGASTTSPTPWGGRSLGRLIGTTSGISSIVSSG